MKILYYFFIVGLIFLSSPLASSEEGVVWRSSLREAYVYQKGDLPFDIEKVHIQLASEEFRVFRQLKSMQDDEKGY